LGVKIKRGFSVEVISLDKQTELKKVKLLNRTVCSSERFSNFQSCFHR